MDFMRILFGVVMLYVHEASSSVYISTTSRGYTSTETGSPSFQCYISHPYLTAAVSNGRYVYVFNDINDPANDDPPLDIPFNAGNPPIQAYRINLETAEHRSYGAFYCAASLDGERSVVPTVFLRSDAKFVPTSGRFSKTVNKGDVNVTVDFTEVTPSNFAKNWRFNGTIYGSNTISEGTIFEELTVYTIIGEVDTSNGGVYELHLETERGMARAGLLRLIVRACPAGRFHVSSGCTQTCPSCYNGGICHDETGICICPPGFQGDGCEMACGGNRYGRDCEYRCDYEIYDDRTACSGLQVCVPDPYGCSCTPGYKGLDCTTECDQGEFGASCTETCHCVSGECDRFTGVCTGSSTECAPEWTGSNCQECMMGRYGPNCEPFTTAYEKANKGQRANFSCGLEGGNLISTAEPVITLYRKFVSESYTQEKRITQTGNGAHRNAEFLFTMANVKVGEMFYCSLSDVNIFWSDKITADGEFTQPELPSAPVVSVTTNNSVTLMWEPWQASIDIGDPPLKTYRVYYRLNHPQAEDQEVIGSDRLAPSETVTGLSPDTDYVFGVAAARPGVGGRGSILEVEGTTQCSPPSGVVMAVNASSSSLLRTIHVNWMNPSSEANCRSGLTGVRIYWESVERSSVVQGSIDVPLTASNGYDLTLPEPYTTYAITAAMINSDAEGVRSEQSLATTAEESAPSPSDIRAVSANSFIIVKWNASTPVHRNGNMKGYTINYERVQPVSEEEQSEFITTNQLMDMIYIIEGVQEGEKYEIRINTVNGVGSSEWSTTKLVEALGDASRYSLTALLLTGLIPSILLLSICVICVILIVVFFRRRQPEPDKGESEKNTYDDTMQSPGAAETYQDLYERVSNDVTAYQELELTSVQQGDINYINIDKDPRGRKNILKSIENADC